MAAKKRSTTQKQRAATRPRKKRRKKAGGRRGGRPKGSRVPGSKSERIRELLGSGMSTPQIAEKVGCSTNLVYFVKSQGLAATKRTRSGPSRSTRPGTDGLRDLASAVREMQRQRDELRRALEKISTAVDAALH